MRTLTLSWNPVSLSQVPWDPTLGVVRRVSFVGPHLAVSGMTPLATLGQFLEQVLCRWSVHLSIRYEWAGMCSAGVARPSRPQPPSWASEGTGPPEGSAGLRCDATPASGVPAGARYPAGRRGQGRPHPRSWGSWGSRGW